MHFCMNAFCETSQDSIKNVGCERVCLRVFQRRYRKCGKPSCVVKSFQLDFDSRYLPGSTIDKLQMDSLHFA